MRRKKYNNGNKKINFLIISIIIIFILSAVGVTFTLFTTNSDGTIESSDNLSGVFDNQVIVDEEEADWYYYQGLNYTESSDGTLPSGVNQEKYNASNLVKVKITYSGTDISDSSLVGYTSLDERQNEYVYYKCYPVVSGYVTIELIDNPFSDRPDGKGFNGWVTDYEGASISYDDNYYVRYVKIPVVSKDSLNEDINITMHASWIDATVGIMSSSNNQWSSAFEKLNSKGIQMVGERVAVYEDITSYYVRETIRRGESYPSGAVNSSGQSQTGTCRSNGGWGGSSTCTYYVLATGEYDDSITYYKLSGWSGMTEYTPQIVDYQNKGFLAEGNLLAGYFRKVDSSNLTKPGYYDENGVYQENVTCSYYSDCNYYELIQYYDDSGNVEVASANEVYYYLVTRDTNIIVLSTNISGSWGSSYDKPLTVTSIYNGQDYRSSATWTINNTYVKCYNDTVIENVTINSRASSSSNNPSSNSNSSGYLYGNYNNVKVGRGIKQSGSYKTFNGIIGGNNVSSNMGSSSNTVKYKLVVESGWYNNISLTEGPLYNSNTKYIEAIGLYGNDYDKVTKNNGNLDVYYVVSGSWGGGNYYSSSVTTGITFDTIVRSGKFGTGKKDHTTGIYVGGRSYGTHYTARRVKVEGGWIYNLIGGPLTANNRGLLNDTYINITGGEVDVVVGGAGTSATYGNRIISITGGKVNYSVFGGSNGYDGSSSDGTLNGSSFIYVGGVAVIGDSGYVSADSVLWGSEAGSIFGIGNGKEGTSSIGSSDNSNIVIDGKAVVNRNVYGGGNFGATGISSSSNSNVTNIWIKGGTVNGSVYGGGNNNGAGSASKISSINIEMSDGSVKGSVYGGANKLGVVYGNVNLNVFGGTVYGSVYGGGEGGYQSTTNYGTFVTEEVNINIGIKNNDVVPVIKTSVYGGSAFGTVGGNENNDTVSNYDTNVVINAGIIENVYGGGQGSDEYTPYVLGNVSVNVYGGTIENVYGGNDLAGTPNGSVNVLIDGGMVNNAYAGGNQTKVSKPVIKLLGGTVNNAFGGGNNAMVDVSDVLLDGSDCQNVYGGSNTSGSVSESNILALSGSAVAIYGGNNLGGTTGVTNVVINGGDIGAVYGGGNETSVLESTNVSLNAGVDTLFGGSNVSGDVPNSYITVNNGSAIDIYGGNNAGGVTSTSNIDINGGFINNLYGGGLNATTGISNVNVFYGYIDNLYGGGSKAGVDNTYINLDKGVINNAFGGSNNSGNIKNTYINNMNSEVISSNFVANSSYTVGNVNNSGAVDIASSEVINVEIVNNTSVDIVEWDYYLMGSKMIFDSNWSSANVSTVLGAIKVDEVNQYYGINTIASGSKYSFSFNVHSYVSYDDFELYGYILIGYDNKGNEYKTVAFDSVFIDKLYGGNNLGGVTTNSNINLTDGNIGTVYGGGEKAITNLCKVKFTDNVSVNYDIFGGGNKAKVNTNTDITLDGIYVGGTVYGGGSAGDVDGNITLNVSNSSVIENIYGGGDAGKVVGNVNLLVNSDEISGSVFGGGNQASVEGDTIVKITDSTALNIYGGGNAGKILKIVDLTIESSYINKNIYGGGNQEDVLGNVKLNVGYNTTALNVYGGGNAGRVVGDITVDISNSSALESVYGGGDAGRVLGKVNLTLNSGLISKNIYGGGNKEAVDKDIIVKINNGTKALNIYGGGNAGEVGGDITLDISGSSVSENIYGGGDAGKVLKGVNLIFVDGTISGNIYGGGNKASIANDTDVTIKNSSIYKNVFGGGNYGSVLGNTNLTVSDTSVLESLYGGGNDAVVMGNSVVSVDGCTISSNIFGGGNNGAMGGSSSVNIVNCTVNDSIYAGGNGVTASVVGNTLLNVSGVTNVVNHIFGGGNAASVGCESALTLDDGTVLNCSNPNNSISEVNIASAIVGGNVYGGANTSKLYGIVYLNLGVDTISSEYSLVKGDIDIVGTVFGGGEANASGSEDYDFSFISVTKGININIDAKGYDLFNISGSIFGSGNASSSGGYSYINISNYGNFSNYKNNISIQRSDIVTLDNSAIELYGAKDRTNEFDNELFTISRVDELKLINGSVIFLDRTTNLLKKLSSLVFVDGKEVKANVEIDDDYKVVRNVNNRVYMYEGKNLNISDSETLGSYGEVDGMAFFGMFTKDRNNNITTALYSDKYNSLDDVISSELYYFSSGSYVVGLHESNHNYYVDGFYSNYVNEDGTGIYTDYIIPTPPNASYYRWVIGEEINSIEFDLTASKYSTLGTYELNLLNYYTPNTEISVLGVNFDDLSSDVSLLASSDIPRIAKSNTDADSNFGLGMKSGNSGWITVGDTEFLTDGGVKGTDTYYKDNSGDIPSFVFYLYHSKNLTDTKDLGSVTISLMIVTPIDELSNKVERINIVVNLHTALFDGDFYEATINVGSHYELFANSPVNITNDGTFSAYYSLFSNTLDIYKDSYYRSLVSSYVLPIDTKITMIDMASGDNSEYYYYTVTKDDYEKALLEYSQEGEVSYVLSKFIKMGSSSLDNNYNDKMKNSIYYDSKTGATSEEFIFIVDFGESDISSDVLNKSLLLEVRNANDSAVIPVLGVSQEKMVYNLYEGKDAIVTVSGSLSSDRIYIGDSVNLYAVTDFVQDKTINSSIIYDTKYFDEKLGIRLSIYDSNNNLVNGAGLLGVSFTYNGSTYYPREDGTVRFNIAERVTNVAARIKINTKGSKLSSGNYKLVIESFGSYDGIYYGLVPSSSASVNLEIINHIFGLDVSLDEKEVIIDSETGYTLNDNNLLNFNLRYDSGLEKPNIRISLYRRNYDDIYNLGYDLVDLDDYLSINSFSNSNNEFEYMAVNNPKETNKVVLKLKDNLMTGTYKVMFKLYDDDAYIGSVYQYIIIE